MKERVVMTIGTFDGVHLGHKKVIDKLVDISKKNNIKSVVVSFNNIPKNIISGTKHISIISSDEKNKLLKNLGVDYVHLINFDKNIQNMSQVDFLKQFDYEIHTLIFGYDFHFGKNKYDVDLYGINVLRVEPYYYEKEIVSSTLIRKYLLDGNIDLANKMLGREYLISENVVCGKKIGRTIGFPTINFNASKEHELLKKGVYSSYVFVEDVRYESITNIGYKPTVDGLKPCIETHIFDFNKNIYGKKINLYLNKFIREERKFTSIDELKKQIQIDILSIK